MASAFEINATDLDVDAAAVETAAANQRGQKYGYAGAVLGLVGAYSGISLDLVGGGMSIGEAGVYYGVVGALFGICCAAIGWSSGKHLQRKASQQ